jgi:hypothetical protein
MVFVLVGVSANLGCRSEGPSSPPTNLNVILPYNTVIVLDKSVTDMTAFLPWERQSVIAIDRNVKSVTATGLMKVDIAIRNRTERTLKLDVQAKFFADDNLEIDKSAVDVIVLRPQDTHAYSISSLKANADKYRIEISGAQ